MKLEVGKKYMRRDGSGPVEITGYYEGHKYKWKASDEESYTDEGKVNLSCLCDADLISEYIEPVKYNEGDLVTVKLKNIDANNLNQLGHTAVIGQNQIIDHKPAPKPKSGTFWVNVYPDGYSIYETKPIADKYARENRIACVEVKWTEGDGL